MRRNCGSVIVTMLKSIPETQVELITDLSANFVDAQYKAPEETIQWERTQQTVLSVFTTRPIWELKKLFSGEFELKLCDKYIRMTNHLGDVCQKCKPKVEFDVL